MSNSLMESLKVNGQPLDKLCYNRDNFQRLKDSYREAMDLVVTLNARLTTKEAAKPKATTKKK